jgi:hypothetical protein
MGETRDRGVLASTECIQQLKEAEARLRDGESNFSLFKASHKQECLM